MEFFVKASDGEQIFVRKHGEDTEKAILLIHGLAEHSGRYDFFSKKLNEDGWTVFAMDFRGHGRSGSKKGDEKSTKRLLEDIKNVCDVINPNKKFKKFGIFGHSAGGGIASLFASQNKLDFLVLSSPVVYVPKKAKILNFLPYKILHFVKIKKRISESKKMLEKSFEDPLATNIFSMRSIGILLCEIPKKVRKNAENIKCPTFLGFGEKDTLLTEKEKFFEFFNKLKNKKNEICEFEDANHRLVNNVGREKHIEKILSWLKKV